jgi:hypothetical protein
MNSESGHTADDPLEVTELERAAEWRLRLVDADPGDQQSAAAAKLLQTLADELRQLQGSPLYREYGAICNWLAESDDISDFAQLAHDYRTRIGFGESPRTGEDYLRALLQLAWQIAGTM